MPNTETIAARRATFRRMHERGCFVIPNPFDIGSARCLQMLGFPAVATSSAGFGLTRALPDDVKALSLDMVLEHVRDIVNAVDVPVNADFQNGYAANPDEVTANVKRCIDTGVAGLSIEDATGDSDRPLYELSEAVDRMLAARAAIDASKSGVMLTGRAECFLVGHSDPLRESIRRLQAYAEAGADVLFAPGVRDREQIREMVQAVAPKPVNVLVNANNGLRVNDFAELGARRISVGAALARAAWGGFLRTAKAIAKDGDFSGFDHAASYAELSGMFVTTRSR